MDADLISALLLFWFIGAVLASFGRIARRWLGYKRNDESPPTLLNRDLWREAGLGISFALILGVRVLIQVLPQHDSEQLRALIGGNVWWYLVTGLPACVGATINAYYEYAKVEAPRYYFDHPHSDHHHTPPGGVRNEYRTSSEASEAAPERPRNERRGLRSRDRGMRPRLRIGW